jgi:hypothetical protein
VREAAGISRWHSSIYYRVDRVFSEGQRGGRQYLGDKDINELVFFVIFTNVKGQLNKPSGRRTALVKTCIIVV